MGGSGGMFGQAKQKSAGEFRVSAGDKLLEREAMTRQSEIAKGSGPMISSMMMNKNIDQSNQAAMAMAASQRGASNPMVAFRQAQLANQQNTMQGAQDATMMDLQERRQADGFIQQGVNAQRGVALQSALGNQSADTQRAAATMGMVSGLGTAMMGMKGAAAKKAYGGVIEGEAPVEGDSYQNDTIPITVSPGEVVVPRSAASDADTLSAFVKALGLPKKSDLDDSKRTLTALLSTAKKLSSEISKKKKEEK